MNNKDFMAIAREIEKHLNENKIFVADAKRLHDVAYATALAKHLFKDMNVYTKHDSLQLGSMVLCIEGFDIIIRGQHKVHIFNEIISKSDNFEIYSSAENIKLSIMFNNVWERVTTK